MSWVVLLLASLLEAIWAISMKFADGFRRPGWTACMLVTMAASVVLLGIAVREIPVGTAYAVWTGMGALLVALFGMIRLGESRAPAQVFCLALIILGVVGLRLGGSA